MTFLTTRYRLVRTLAAQDLQNLCRLSTRYGIRSLNVEGEYLVVEYDASRIHEAEVLAQIRKAGIRAISAPSTRLPCPTQPG